MAQRSIYRHTRVPAVSETSSCLPKTGSVSSWPLRSGPTNWTPIILRGYASPFTEAFLLAKNTKPDAFATSWHKGLNLGPKWHLGGKMGPNWQARFAVLVCLVPTNLHSEDRRLVTVASAFSREPNDLRCTLLFLPALSQQPAL